MINIIIYNFIRLKGSVHNKHLYPFSINCSNLCQKSITLFVVWLLIVTLFYLPPTHEPYVPLLHSRKALLPFGWYYCAHPQRDGQAELTRVADYIPRYMSRTGN